jgi:excisionase family DNA binding protein
MPTRSPKTDILMIKDVAEYLKVTERTIYRLAAAKKIPAFKVGGSWRFSRTDLDNWIREQTRSPTGECRFQDRWELNNATNAATA